MFQLTSHDTLTKRWYQIKYFLSFSFLFEHCAHCKYTWYAPLKYRIDGIGTQVQCIDSYISIVYILWIALRAHCQYTWYAPLIYSDGWHWYTGAMHWELHKHCLHCTHCIVRSLIRLIVLTFIFHCSYFTDAGYTMILFLYRFALFYNWFIQNTLILNIFPWIQM